MKKVKQLFNYYRLCKNGLHISVSLEVELHNIWLGVFWNKEASTPLVTMSGGYPILRIVKRDIFICLLPCLPLHLSLFRQEVVQDSEVEQFVQGEVHRVNLMMAAMKEYRVDMEVAKRIKEEQTKKTEEPKKEQERGNPGKP